LAKCCIDITSMKRLTCRCVVRGVARFECGHRATQTYVTLVRQLCFSAQSVTIATHWTILKTTTETISDFCDVCSIIDSYYYFH
jgi:hypothetical protein